MDHLQNLALEYTWGLSMVYLGDKGNGVHRLGKKEVSVHIHPWMGLNCEPVCNLCDWGANLARVYETWHNITTRGAWGACIE